MGSAIEARASRMNHQRKSGASVTKPPKKPSQTERFVAKAREIGCDEDEAAFDAMLRKIGNAQTEKKPAKAKKTKRT